MKKKAKSDSPKRKENRRKLAQRSKARAAGAAILAAPANSPVLPAKPRRPSKAEIVARPCPLCLVSDIEKIDSHIVPGFMFKPLMRTNPDGSRESLTVEADPDKEPKRSGKGFKEKLLCANCDNLILGRYEDYATQWFVKFKDQPKIEVDGQELSIPVEYERFKLFGEFTVSWLEQAC